MGQQIESPPPPVDPEQRKDGEGGAYRGRGGGAIGETAHKKVHSTLLASHRLIDYSSDGCKIVKSIFTD